MGIRMIRMIRMRGILLGVVVRVVLRLEVLGVWDVLGVWRAGRWEMRVKVP